MTDQAVDELPPGPVDGSLCDRAELPLSALVPMLAREAVRPKAIYQTHKWFARRLGTAFRALLVGTESTTESDFWRRFYDGNRTGRGRLLDPFVGGGTSIIEGYRLGYDCIGIDIDPAAAVVSKFGAQVAGLPCLAEALEDLVTSMRKALADVYGFRRDWTGTIPIHYFWVQVATCPGCGASVDCHPSLQIAANKEAGCQWVLDPRDGQIVELPLHRKRLHRGPVIDQSNVSYGTLSCPECSLRTALIDLEGAPNWRLFAIEETENPKDGKVTPNALRTFRGATDADRARFARARNRLRQLDQEGFLPEDVIPSFPSGDRRLSSYGYTRFRDLFNARQLLHLGLLAQRISKFPAEVAEPLAVAFSDHLTTNCMLTNYAGGWRRLAPLFSIRAYRHVCRPVELNPWLDATGRGTFPNAVRGIVRAQKAMLCPAEPTPDGGFKSVPFDETIAAQTEVQVHARDSRNLRMVRTASVDIVLSDPPYFDHIAYAELSAFFKPWMRHLGLIAAGRNVIDAGTLGSKKRGLSSADEFHEGLRQCLVEVARILKTSGRFVFTFQNSSHEAWHSLGLSLAHAGLSVISVFPLLGERPDGLHKHVNSISWDAVLVCRNGASTSAPHEPSRPDGWVEKQLERWRKKLAPITCATFTKADEGNLRAALELQWNLGQGLKVHKFGLAIAGRS